MPLNHCLQGFDDSPQNGDMTTFKIMPETLLWTVMCAFADYLELPRQHILFLTTDGDTLNPVATAAQVTCVQHHMNQ